MPTNISAHEIEAFKKFVLKLPHGKDIVLVVLKGQLLIEEQVKLIVRERVRIFSCLERERFSFYQYVCLANALVGREAPTWIWSSLKRLGKLRNQIAHEMEPHSLNADVEKFIASVPGDFQKVGLQEHLELKLWGLFVNVSALVNNPNATIATLSEHRKK